MNRKRQRKKPKGEMKKSRDWHRKLQSGCTVKMKGKEKLPKKQLRKPRKQLNRHKKQLEKQLKKRKESSMRSYKSRRQKG